MSNPETNKQQQPQLQTEQTDTTESESVQEDQSYGETEPNHRIL